ncbi:MAG: molybdopterin-dependent oxidoreductase, partial [Armatimonadetes bacterium]|nr:molybdopterin-dependent oxidoreductase [Armatimonadota bacterium]
PEKGIGIDPRWKVISWDEALDEIARRLSALRDAGEAHKLIWITEDASFTDIQQDFLRLYGSPNFGMHSNLCDTGRKASFKMVVGDERPLIDALQSKYMLIFGWNPVSATKWSLLPRIITRGIEHGAKLVVVDPNLSYTASKAHEWVPIRPATDGALALAMGHVIIRDGLYDKEFVEQWTTGFDEYAAYVKDKTPQWAEDITTVPAERIERLAREFATTKPATLDVWSGAHHSNGVNAGRAIACLAALVGSYDIPGGLHLPDRKGPKYQPAEAPDVPSLKQPRLDGSGTKYPYKHASGVYCEWVERTAKGDGPYQPKILVSIFQNPMMAVIGTKTAEEALKRLEFIVQIDTMLSETAQFADIVLPGTTYFERYDLDAPWVTWPSVTLRQPVVQPLFGQPAEYEAIIRLGRLLHLRTKDGKAFFIEGPESGKPVDSLTRWYEEYLSRELKAGGPKMGLAELKALPGAVWVDTKGTRYQKYADPIAEDIVAKSVVDGELLYDKPKAEGGQAIGRLVNGTWVKGFNTSTRKIELASAAWASKKDANGKPIPALPV